MKIDALQTLALAVFVLALVVIAAASLYFGARIATSRIPMQWGFEGRPTWYAARILGLWWLLYFTLSIGFGLIALAHFSENPKATSIWYTIIAFSVITAVSQVWHLNAVSKWAASQ